MDKHHNIKPFPTVIQTREGYFQAQVADKTMKAQRGKNGGGGSTSCCSRTQETLQQRSSWERQ